MDAQPPLDLHPGGGFVIATAESVQADVVVVDGLGEIAHGEIRCQVPAPPMPLPPQAEIEGPVGFGFHRVRIIGIEGPHAPPLDGEEEPVGMGERWVFINGASDFIRTVPTIWFAITKIGFVDALIITTLKLAIRANWFVSF